MKWKFRQYVSSYNITKPAQSCPANQKLITAAMLNASKNSMQLDSSHFHLWALWNFQASKIIALYILTVPRQSKILSNRYCRITRISTRQNVYRIERYTSLSSGWYETKIAFADMIVPRCNWRRPCFPMIFTDLSLSRRFVGFPRGRLHRSSKTI